MPTIEVQTDDSLTLEPLRQALTSVLSKAGKLYTGSASSVASTEDSYGGLLAANGQDYSYPTEALCVRNTFVDLQMPGRDPSLEAFFEERRINSWDGTLKAASFKHSWSIEGEESLGTIPSGSTSDCSEYPCTPPPELASDDFNMSDVEDMNDVDAPPIPPISSGVGRRASCATEVNSREATDSAGKLHANFMPPTGPGAVFSREATVPAGMLHGNFMPPPGAVFPPREATEPAGKAHGNFMPPPGAVFPPREATEPAGKAHGNFMPPPVALGKTMSDYRHAGSQYLTQSSQYPPGHPLSGAPDPRCAAKSGHLPEYSADVQQSRFGGSMDGREGLASGFERGYSNPNPIPSCYQARPMGANLDASQRIPPPYLPAPQQIQASQPSQPPQVLQLAAALPSAPAAPPSASTEIIPTKGSMLHASGRCKPCAFLYTKGCENGFDCPFCHLCEPGEKKRRRKEKVEARRIMRELRDAVSYNGFA